MKKTIIGIGLIILLIGSFLVLKLKSSSVKEEVELTPTPSVVLPTVSEQVKVDLQATGNKQAVSLSISGYDTSVESIEYELTYMTGAGLPRGVLGKITLKGESEVNRDDIVLGTCSSGRCVYDTGVTSIDLSLRFNSSTGSSSVFRKTYPL